MNAQFVKPAAIDLGLVSEREVLAGTASATA
jgi:hypothetical protein